MARLPLGVVYAASTGTVDDRPATERWLSQLAGVFTDESAYNQALANGDSLVYRVTNMEENTGEGQLHYALGVLMPGRVGDEYYMTRGHIHAWRPAAEVYICLSGQGLMLLQNDRTGESTAVDLTPSQLVYVPGHAAHRTINTGSTPLIYWGILSSEAGHDYEYVRQNPFKQVVIQGESGPVVLDREQYLQRLMRAAQ